MSPDIGIESDRRSRRNIAATAADLVEAVFGPDPGLLRFRMALRTLISAGATLGALLALLGSANLQAIAAIFLGFVSCLFSNISVRDTHFRQQAITLSLLPLPALGSVAAASFLSARPWAVDLGFVAVVMAAAAARSLGPRGMAVGMVGFISYFVGVILKPPLADMPNLAIAVVIGTGAAAVVRLVLLPDRPRAALQHIRREIYRRLERLIRLTEEMLASDPSERADETHALRDRSRAAIARLQDTLLAAQEQLDSLKRDDGQQRAPSTLFALGLDAERLTRIAALERPDAPREQIRAQLRLVAAQLRADGEPVWRRGLPPGGKFSSAIDRLERDIARLSRELRAESAAQS